VRFLLEWPRHIVGGTLAIIGFCLTLSGEGFVRTAAWVLEMSTDDLLSPDTDEWL
jgi:hypothetical protein